MKVAFKIDKGKIRENNEDAFYLNERMRVFIVADGMGGHNAGEIASNMAIEIISKYLLEKINETKTREGIYNILHSAILTAHKEIKETSYKEPKLKGMGTTVVLAFIKRNHLYVANVGDSRAYILNSSKIKQITEDHSIVSYLLKSNLITEEEAKNHSQKHIITQALGVSEEIIPYITDIFLNKDNKILLCTDGLTDLLSDEEIREIVNSTNEDINWAVESLIAEANRKGGTDNITAILVGGI